MNHESRKYRLLINLEAPDESVVRGEGLIPMLEEIGIGELEQVVGVGRNKFLIISKNNLSEYDQQDITTRDGVFLWCKHPGPPSVTITAFGMNVDWPNSVLTDKLDNYYEDPIEIKYGAYKNWPSIKNGLRHIKVKRVDPKIPRALIIEGRTIKIRLPGEPLRDTKCYKCGRDGHNRADCPDDSRIESPTPIQTPTNTYADRAKSPPIDPKPHAPLQAPPIHPRTQFKPADNRPPSPKQQNLKQTPPQHQLQTQQQNTTLGDFIDVAKRRKTPTKTPTVMPPPNSIPKPKTFTRETNIKDKTNKNCL